MADEDDVRRLALSLPEVTEDDSGMHVRVRGKGFAWFYLERVAGQRKRVPRRDVLVVRVAGEYDKQGLLATDPEKLFTSDHYDGYPAVLVRLPVIETDELADWIADAWRSRAPRALVTDRDGDPASDQA